MIAGLNWDHFRFILVVSKLGSINEVSKSLNLNRTTVKRRIDSIEKDFGTQLFEQDNGNLCPTSQCYEFISLAEKIEFDLYKYSSEIFNIDSQLKGSITFATKDIFACFWSRDFLKFREHYPGIKLEILALKEAANLSKREADIAVRMIKGSPPENLIGKNLCEIGFAFYGSERLGDLSEASYWSGYDESIDQKMLDQLIYKQQKSANIKIRVNSVPIQIELIKTGKTIGMLPCFIGDSTKGIKRLSDVLDYKLDLWLLTHPEIVKKARIKAFMDFFTEVIKRNKKIIEGEII